MTPSQPTAALESDPTPEHPHPELGVVILGAGASSRMGRPKLLLPWGATSVLGHLIRQWHTLAPRQIAVVCSTVDPAVSAELGRFGDTRAHAIPNPAPEQGMFSSIQCAARWDGWDAALLHWAIALGDQPHLRVETLHRLLRFARLHPERICQPSRNGHPRHPVVLPKTLFEQLKDSNAGTFRQFLDEHASAVARCEVDDPGLDFDLDTPADYEEAVRRFQSAPVGATTARRE